MRFVSLLILLLCGSGALAASPATGGAYALLGARARSVHSSVDSSAGRSEFLYRSRGWLGLEGLRVEAVRIDTGERLPLRVLRNEGEDWRLRLEGDESFLREWARQPYMLMVSDPQGNEVDRTYFQLGALLDQLYDYRGCLGVCWANGKPTLRLWAPTARNVQVSWVDGGGAEPMALKPEGIWEISGPASWDGRGYLFEVEVFTPATGRVEKHRVTDPYSLALAVNSRHSVLVNPTDPRWTPAGWDSVARPALAARTDAVLYELHLRDFSAGDTSVPAELRGTYRAFTVTESEGSRHLGDLARAGITHVHLLPLQDFASVEEDPRQRREAEIPVDLPGDSPVPQSQLAKVRALDAYNWGYDPFHYFAPEGSYATQPAGGARIREVREMVLALRRHGLRTVLDVVFNHTMGSGIEVSSVLDRVVPGYYYRLDVEGRVRNSSCCSDTASERRMMEKLMGDALEAWRTIYKIDGFRFDLMNLHGVSTMRRLRDRLRAEDPSLLLYGEAWSFGSLLEQDPGDAFTQPRAYGQGIGVFNDRLRDAVRGGTTSSTQKSDQGFATGLFYDFNHEPANRATPVDLGAQREKLLWLTDVVRVGMAGNLRDYRFRNFRGDWINGGQLQFNGGPVGVAQDPEDTVNYVSAHDGYTLWDALQAKLPFHTRSREPSTAPIEERVDRQILALGIVAFSQGVPFFDSAAELLRSKSGDQNSYDSGDWFNRIDWTGRENGWARGLPPMFSNYGDEAFWAPRLADDALAVGPAEIERARRAFLEMLTLRKSSPLFRLRSGAEIQARVRDLNGELGPMQRPGLMVMEIADEDADGRDLDPRWRRLLVAVNATNETAFFSHPTLRRGAIERLFGGGEAKLSRDAQLALPPRSITVWGERP